MEQRSLLAICAEDLIALPTGEWIDPRLIVKAILFDAAPVNKTLRLPDELPRVVLQLEGGDRYVLEQTDHESALATARRYGEMANAARRATRDALTLRIA